ncbi:MJ0042-type zinc finger domain-containing protein [Neisseria sp. Ec49-e6-T10]|uniref:MJ0042-type zinc finger domain-containing protein n=1 Tax=Neisseria sp. Ec49-e6-T10 TaxID=3140744 RepID=UPI003EB9A391
MLVTFCPKCHTSFYITQKQIEHAKGNVKCGQCGTLFNAHEHLEPSSGEETTGGYHTNNLTNTQERSTEQFFSGRSLLNEKNQQTQNFTDYTAEVQASKTAQINDMPFSLVPDDEEEKSNEAEKAQPESITEAEATTSSTFFSKEDPFEVHHQDSEKEKQLNLSIQKLRQYADHNTQAQQQEQSRSKWGLFAIGSIVAVLCLLLQLVVFNWPQSNQTDPIQLLSSSLQEEGNRIILNIEAQMEKNQTQLPTLYVTLQDEQEKTIVNKAFSSEQYLKHSKNENGKLSIELNMDVKEPITIGSHEVFWQ